MTPSLEKLLDKVSFEVRCETYSLSSALFHIRTLLQEMTLLFTTLISWWVALLEYLGLIQLQQPLLQGLPGADVAGSEEQTLEESLYQTTTEATFAAAESDPVLVNGVRRMNAPDSVSDVHLSASMCSDSEEELGDRLLLDA